MLKKLLKITLPLAAAALLIAPAILILRMKLTEKRVAENRDRIHAFAREKVYRGHDDTVVIDEADYADDPEE